MLALILQLCIGENASKLILECTGVDLIAARAYENTRGILLQILKRDIELSDKGLYQE